MGSLYYFTQILHKLTNFTGVSYNPIVTNVKTVKKRSGDCAKERKKCMDIFNFLTMLGGLALFLYGMNVMGDGLTRASGGRLRRFWRS